VAVLAHEVGHHVLSPGDLFTRARLVERVRMGLVDRDADAALVANLWSDMLINDRLQRRAGVRMDLLWRAIGPPTDPLFRMVMRADELLWQLAPGALTGIRAAGTSESDAQLCAQLVRVYADDPVAGAGGFAALRRPLLPEPDSGPGRRLATLVCAQHVPAGTRLPPGLTEDPSLTEPVRHPALDPLVNDELDEGDRMDLPPVTVPGSGQAFGPADMAAVLGALGVTNDPTTAAVAFYRDRASRYLIRFPSIAHAARTEPLLEGLQDWETGDDVADVDWTGTLLRSSVIIPGVTTVRRSYGDEPGAEAERTPLDLDLYVDSSGSMPNPQTALSAPALAGAVLALSALRSGDRAQVTTWSGPGQLWEPTALSRTPIRSCGRWWPTSAAPPASRCRCSPAPTSRGAAPALGDHATLPSSPTPESCPCSAPVSRQRWLTSPCGRCSPQAEVAAWSCRHRQAGASRCVSLPRVMRCTP